MVMACGEEGQPLLPAQYKQQVPAHLIHLYHSP